MPTLTVPRNSDELAEMLHDPARRRDILETEDTLADFITAYAKDQATNDPGIAQQIRDEVKRLYAEELRGDRVDRVNVADIAPVARNAQYNPRAAGAKLDKDFPDWVSYMQAIHGGATEKSVQARTKLQEVRNALGSTIPSDGGFLIPEVLRSELLKIALERAIVRPLARVIPMDSLTVPFPTIDSTSNASSVYGGLTGYWTEEGAALTDSSPKFGRVLLQAKKLTIYSEIPNELLADSLISLQAFLDQAFPEALAWFEDVAFISGTGVGEPLGFLNAPAAVSVAKEAGQAAATIVWENIVNAYSRMLPASISRAVWIAHIDTFPQLATMSLSVGTGGSAVWIGNGAGNAVGAGAGAPPMTILGRPVIFTEKVSTTGTVGDISFVDLGYYLIGDRQAMQADTSNEYRFGNDKTALRVIERVDGRPWIQSAITPKSGSNTLSPFVNVATR